MILKHWVAQETRLQIRVSPCLAFNVRDDQPNTGGPDTFSTCTSRTSSSWPCDDPSLPMTYRWGVVLQSEQLPMMTYHLLRSTTASLPMTYRGEAVEQSELLPMMTYHLLRSTTAGDHACRRPPLSGESSSALSSSSARCATPWVCP